MKYNETILESILKLLKYTYKYLKSILESIDQLFTISRPCSEQTRAQRPQGALCALRALPRGAPLGGDIQRALVAGDDNHTWGAAPNVRTLDP